MNYIEEVVKLESTLYTDEAHRFAHAAIGLVTESLEIIIAQENDDLDNLFEEIGDTYWYVALMCHVLDMTMEEVEAIDAQVENEGMVPFILLDNAKKALFYGRTIDRDTMAVLLSVIIQTLREEVEDQGWTVDQVLEGNIQKLKKRYGEKFSTEAAINREIA